MLDGANATQGPGAPESASPAELDQQFDEAYRLLVEPAQFQRKLLLLFGTLALFVFVQLGGSNALEKAAIVVGVLLFHELGHFVGMRAFGYRDVRMFFIPFLGAAVSGRSGGVAAWKEAIVLLLGPIPGMVVGGAMLAWTRLHPEQPMIQNVAVTLLAINGFNLLPIEPLDGGKLFRRLLFSRNRYLEIGFLALAGLALIALAIADRMLMIGLVGYLVLAGLPGRWRLMRAAAALRGVHASLPTDPSRLNETEARAVFSAARETLPAKHMTARRIADAMETLLDAIQPPPSAGSTVLLLCAWAMGLVVPFITMVAAEVLRAERSGAMVREPAVSSSASPRGPAYPPGEEPFPFPPELDASYEAAYQALHEGAADVALPRVERVTKEVPDNPRGWSMTGSVYELLARDADAERLLSHSLALGIDDRRRPNVSGRRAFVRLRLGRESDAEGDSSAALAMDDAEPTALLVSVAIASQRGQLDRVRTLLERLVVVAPEIAEGHSLLAALLSDQGDRVRAAEEARRARELGSTSPNLAAIEEGGGQGN